MRDRASAFVIKGNKVLMVRNRYGNREFWAPPGGGIEDNETPEQTAVRELKEETGIDGIIERPLSVKYYIDGRKEYIFLCKMLDENQEAITGYDPEEMSVPKEIRPGVQETAWKTLEELSNIDKCFLMADGYIQAFGIGSPEFVALEKK